MNAPTSCVNLGRNRDLDYAGRPQSAFVDDHGPAILRGFIHDPDAGPWTARRAKLPNTSSFLGKAFSVIIARGRFRSPRGQAGSSHKPRTWSITLSISFAGQDSLERRHDREKDRARPPCVITARHWTSDSGVDVEQSLKSGNDLGGSKPIRSSCPFPSLP